MSRFNPITSCGNHHAVRRNLTVKIGERLYDANMNDYARKEKRKKINKGCFMFAAYLICLLLGIGLFFALAHFPLWIRLTTSVLTTLVLSTIVTTFITKLRDRPIGETRTIRKEDLP